MEKSKQRSRLEAIALGGKVQSMARFAEKYIQENNGRFQ